MAADPGFGGIRSIPLNRDSRPIYAPSARQPSVRFLFFLNLFGGEAE